MSFLLTADQIAAAGAVAVSNKRQAKALPWAKEVTDAINANGSATIPYELFKNKSAGNRFCREFKSNNAGYRIKVTKLVKADKSVFAVRLTKTAIVAA